VSKGKNKRIIKLQGRKSVKIKYHFMQQAISLDDKGIGIRRVIAGSLSPALFKTFIKYTLFNRILKYFSLKFSM
jgi:hypothetical protein